MIPYVRGKVTRQAHVDIPEGCVEEEVGREGFFGKYAHLYRTEPPVNWTRIDGPLRPHGYDTQKMTLQGADDFLSRRHPILHNRDLSIEFASFSKEMVYFFRNADGDDLYFIHQGAGILETDFGPLPYRRGDYLGVPRGTMIRFVPHDFNQILVIESYSELQFPNKGMLGHHALFDPAVLDVPEPATPPSQLPAQKEYLVKVKREGEITTIYYPNNPLNVVGWKGDLSVWRLNVADIRPISSDRYHLPPSAHTTLVAKNFVVCSFLPRPLEVGDPGALRVPFYHSNIDYDEILFYHDGDFFSRAGISPGMLTYHPQGIHHGPHPKAIERSQKQERTNEVAVMIDTRYPLKPTRQAEEIEIRDYWASWK